jgi:hypothetical protein
MGDRAGLRIDLSGLDDAVTPGFGRGRRLAVHLDLPGGEV